MSVEDDTVVSCVHGGVVLVPVCAHTLGARGHSRHLPQSLSTLLIFSDTFSF